MKIEREERVTRRMKMGRVFSQRRVVGLRPETWGGRARFGRRERRGPELGFGGGIRGAFSASCVGVGFGRFEALGVGWVDEFRSWCCDLRFRCDNCRCDDALRGRRRSEWRRLGVRLEMDRRSFMFEAMRMVG